MGRAYIIHLILKVRPVTCMFRASQGSTNFSYYAWANSSIGYKWGSALPEFCFDERWPDGGVWNGSIGLYPSDPTVYGNLAGKPIIPGCEPCSCLPKYYVSNGQGSLHAQVKGRDLCMFR